MDKGFSIVEILLAISFFGLTITGLIGGLVYGQQSIALAGNRARAVFLAEEGLEAVRNIRDDDYTILTPGGKGLAVSSNQWVFSGGLDTTDIFTRTTTISPVGGANSSKKNITVAVTWQQNPQRTGSVTLVSCLTNWQATNMASILSVDTSAAEIDPGNNTRVIGVTLENIGDVPITIASMVTVWSGAPGGTKLDQININGSAVWTGSANSNQTQDITDLVLNPGSGPVAINFLDFSKNMTGTTIQLTFTMNDNSSTTTPSFDP